MAATPPVRQRRVVAVARMDRGGAVASAVRRLGRDLELGRQVYEKANCVGCHKWHGGGGGGYGGAALSLRETALDRELLVEVVRCGRPATRMPYHDRSAYQATDCYGGMTKADLGADFPPKAATLLRDQEILAVAEYVLVRLQGKGEPTRTTASRSGAQIPTNAPR